MEGGGPRKGTVGFWECQLAIALMGNILIFVLESQREIGIFGGGRGETHFERGFLEGL